MATYYWQDIQNYELSLDRAPKNCGRLLSPWLNRGIFFSWRVIGGIPKSQHPNSVYRETITDQDRYIQGRVYVFELRGRHVEIREHSLGHKKGNHAPHFNTEATMNRVRIPLAIGDDSHSYFKRWPVDTVFIHQTGIHPWDQLHPTDQREYVTVSLLNQDFENVWKTWRALVTLLTQEWPIILTWYTTMTPQYSKTHEYLTLKHFAQNSGPKDIFKKNETTSVYSGLEYLNPNPEYIDPSKLMAYRSTLTLMLKQDAQPEKLWQRLSHLNLLSTTDDFQWILADEENLTFRFYDAETHGIAQLICHSMHLPKIEQAINSLNIKKINKTYAYEYIHL